MKYRNHAIAAVVAILSVGYISYLRTPSHDWMKPTLPEGDKTQVGKPVRVDFKVRSRDECTLEITRYADRSNASGGIIQLPALAFERKHIRAAPEIRSSFFVVTFPQGTEPGDYRIFSRVRSDCSWLDRLWPRVTDTPSVAITVVP